MEYKVTTFGVETVCYGELLQTSNFQIVCEDENDDCVWADGHPQELDWLDWDDVVITLQPYFTSDILEISAI